MIKRIALIIGILATIIAGIVLYNVSKKEHEENVEKYRLDAASNVLPCMVHGIDTEFYRRLYESGVSYKEWLSMEYYHCEEYEVKTIVTQDTTFQVRIRCGDILDHKRIKQFIFKGFKPIDLKEYNKLFVQDLSRKGFRVKNVFTEYVDIKKDKVIYDSGGSTSWPSKGSFKSDIIPLDIIESIGVRTCVELVYPQFKETLASYSLHFYGLITILVFLTAFLLVYTFVKD